MSCVENPQGYRGVVIGQLLTDDAFYINGVHGSIAVSDGKSPIHITDYYGNFYLENVNNPYDLYISFSEGNYYKLQDLYLGLNSPALSIVLPYESETFLAKTVIVKFPAVPKGKFAIIKFISRDNFVQDTLIANENDSIVRMYVRCMANKSNIAGKIIFLQCTGNLQDTFYIQSYDNFGIKDVNLYGTRRDTIIFTENEINVNPVESSVNVNITTNNKSSENYVFAYINFPDYNNHSDLRIYQTYANRQNFSVTVPAELEKDFTIRVTNNFNVYLYYDTEYQSKSVFLSPGQSGTLDNSQLVSLIYPENDQKVNDTVIFRFYDDSPGIYKINFLSHDARYSVYTEKNNVKFADLKSRGVLFDYGDYVTWYVKKYAEFTTIDQFVSSPYLLQRNFTTEKVSLTRRFFVLNY